MDDYINNYSGEIKNKLVKLRKEINSVDPRLTEKMSWGMPTFYLDGNIAHFAVHKNHIGFYPGPLAIEKFTKELKEYKTSIGAIQFPNDKEIPYDLVKKIVKFNMENY